MKKILIILITIALLSCDKEEIPKYKQQGWVCIENNTYKTLYGLDGVWGTTPYRFNYKHCVIGEPIHILISIFNTDSIVYDEIVTVPQENNVYDEELLRKHKIVIE